VLHFIQKYQPFSYLDFETSCRETFLLTEKARENSWCLNGRFSNVDWLKGKTSGEKSLEFQYKPLESSFRFDFFYL